jgi:hypothetical protein
MLFQITTAGRALIAANPSGVNITRAEFASGFNYVPSADPTTLHGSVVYTANAVFAPEVVNANTLRYTVFIPGPVGPFTFGEVALYAQDVLFGVGAQVTSITKTAGATDNAYRLDVFVDLLAGQNFASFDVVSSATSNFFPRVPSVDALVAPHYDTNNAYVVYGTPQAGEGFMAYSDPTGIWTFSNKPHVWFSGSVTSIGDMGLLSNELVGATYNGNYNDLVLQFITGALRGYCRKLTEVTTNGQFIWNTLLLEKTRVVPGDLFVVSGPSASVGFSGSHNTLGGLQGGVSGEYYHLTSDEHARVQYPRLFTKTVATSTYNVLNTDDDSYIEIDQNCTVSIPDLSTTSYPIGGLIVFRIVNAIITFQGIGGNVLAPLNPTVVDCGGKTVTFAIVRRSATGYDLVAPINVEGGGGGNGSGNVIHSYANNSRSSRNFLPIYSHSGGETGANANIEQSRVEAIGGSLRLYPGDLTVGTDWTAPALLTFPLLVDYSDSSPTGLPNTAALIGLSATINGTSYTIQASGSAMQTYAALVQALNNAAAAVLPVGTLVTFSVAHNQIIMVCTSTAVPTTLVITSAPVFTSGNQATTWNPKLTTASVADSVDATGRVLDGYDALNAQIRPIGQQGVSVGFRSRIVGLFSSIFGGRFTSIEGNYSTAIGSDGGFIHGDRNQLIGGVINTIAPDSEGNSSRPTGVTILGGRNNKIVGVGYITPKNSAIIASDTVKVTGIDSVVIASETGSLVGPNSAQLSSANVELGGANSVSMASNLIIGASSDRVTVIGGASLQVSARNTVILYQHDLNIVQEAALYYPTRSNVVSKGQVGTAFSVHTTAYGASANLILTTDSQAYANTNAMQILNGHGWVIEGTVSANKGSAEFKGWRITASAYNVLGQSYIGGINIEVINETTGSVNWELDLVVNAVNLDKIYFTLNTAGATSGLDTVAVSAFVHVNSARPML